MKSVNIEDVVDYVEQLIGDLHKKNIASLDNLKLKDALRRKNPYLFKTKNILCSWCALVLWAQIFFS